MDPTDTIMETFTDTAAMQILISPEAGEAIMEATVEDGPGLSTEEREVLKEELLVVEAAAATLDLEVAPEEEAGGEEELPDMSRTKTSINERYRFFHSLKK